MISLQYGGARTEVLATHAPLILQCNKSVAGWSRAIAPKGIQAMLSLMTAREIRPEVEIVDRDPGILSLIAAFARFSAQQTAAIVRSVQTVRQRANETEVFSSSTAWPYNHRSR